MPNGPAFNGPTCPVCGLYASVHGCTPERCANLEGPPLSRSEMKRRVLMRGGSEEELREASRYVPPGYVSIASTGADVQAARVCGCERCEADGQHAPMCGVHGDGDEVGPCSCRKGPR